MIIFYVVCFFIIFDSLFDLSFVKEKQFLLFNGEKTTNTRNMIISNSILNILIVVLLYFNIPK